MREKPFSTFKKAIFSHTFDHIHFGQFDAGQVLYHANYFHLLEELRERFLFSKNLSYKGLMDEGYHLPIVESNQKFIRPIHYQEEVVGHLFLGTLKRSSITFEYELQTVDQTVIHLAATTLVSVKAIDGNFKPAILPQFLTDLFEN